jgi:transposase-like protein
METIFRCPACKQQTMGTQTNGCVPSFICPNCQKMGNVVYMTEEKKDNIQNLGNGFFSNKK